MALNAGELEITVKTNTKEITDLKNKINEVDTTAKKSQLSFGKLATGFGLANVGAMALRKGIQFVTRELQASISNSIQAQKVNYLLADAMKRVGIYSQDTYEDLKKYASQLQQNSKYDDEAIKDVEKKLIMYGAEGDMIKKLTKVTLDFASAQEMDLGSASDLIAKTIGSDINALGRYGIEIKKTTDETARMNQVVEKLANMFGGAAQAGAETFEGRLMQLRNAQDDLRESIGNVVTTYGGDFVNGLRKATEGFTSFIETITRIPKSKQLEDEQLQLNILVDQLMRANTSEEDRKRIISEINKINGDLLKGIDLEKGGLEELSKRIAIVNDQYINKIIVSKMEDKVYKELASSADKKAKAYELETQLNEQLMSQGRSLGILDQMNGKTLEQKIKLLDTVIAQRNKQLGVEGNILGETYQYSQTLAQINDLRKSANKNEEKGNELAKAKEELAKKLNVTSTETLKNDNKQNESNKKKNKNAEDQLKVQEKIKKAIDEELKTLEHKIRMEDETVDTTNEQIEAYENLYEKMKKAKLGNEELYKIEEKLKELRDKQSPDKWSPEVKEQTAKFLGSSKPETKTEGGTTTQQIRLTYDIEAFKESSSQIANIIGQTQDIFFSTFQNVFNVISDESATTLEKVASTVQAVGEAIQQTLSMITEMIQEQMQEEIDSLSEQHDTEIEAIDEKLAKEIELIEYNGMTKQQAKEQEVATLQAAIAKETDAAKKANLEEQLSSAQKELNIMDAQEKAKKKKHESDKKFAKEKYKIELEMFNMKKTMDIVQAVISYALGLVSLWANVWSLGPIAGAIMGGILTGVLTGFFAASVAMIASQQPPPPPKFAKGGISSGGGALVGEQGAEYVNLPRGAQVFPAGQTEDILNPNFSIKNELFISGDQMALASGNANKNNYRYESSRR